MTQANEVFPGSEALYRANPAYSLILFDRLPATHQEQLRDMTEDEDFYGVLWPKDGAAAKAVDQETALLYLTLGEPGTIPAYILRKFGHECSRAIAELVLDGVLEIACKGSKEFVSGGSAHPFLFPTQDSQFQSENRLAQMSFDALDYVQRLSLVPAAGLAMRLYRYNTIPLSPSWRRRWREWQSVTHLLKIDQPGPTRTILDQHWRIVSADDDIGWLSWHSTDRKRVSRLQGRMPYKLYISPLPEDLPEAWPIILEVLTHSEAASFKVGKGLQGLLRPDKLVAYLSDFAALANVAKALQQALPEYSAQGVPFSAPIDNEGLLSWGMDPRQDASSFDNQNRESWRTWITGRLAGAIIEARESGAGVEPRQFAVDRLRILGIDTETWVPKQAMWQNAGSIDYDIA